MAFKLDKLRTVKFRKNPLRLNEVFFVRATTNNHSSLRVFESPYSCFEIQQWKFFSKDGKLIFILLF